MTLLVMTPKTATLPGSSNMLTAARICRRYSRDINPLAGKNQRNAKKIVKRSTKKIVKRRRRRYAVIPTGMPNVAQGVGSLCSAVELTWASEGKCVGERRRCVKQGAGFMQCSRGGA
jgi:hypothetical protein